MQTLTELLINRGYKNRVIADTQLARLIGGTPQRRHSLVNRAMKASELGAKVTMINDGLFPATRSHLPRPLYLEAMCHLRPPSLTMAGSPKQCIPQPV